MADYIYLLENRLSAAQRSALRLVRDLARSKNLTVFLVGGAVRDLTSGSPVRDLDVVVQGDARKLKKELEKLGAKLSGEMEPAQAMFFTFPGGVRMEIGSTLTVTYPKPNKPVFKPATILDDLRRRDFTANAMALSLNEGSYGLLMDPLNGVADIENRELRLVSNYGFIEDPIRMVRAARLMARLGWAMDDKTQQRYETVREEKYISSMTAVQRGYETGEIFHEEDPLRVLKRLEADGWMKELAPFWTASKVDVTGLERLRETQTQLQMQGIHPEAAAANFPLLTAKLSAKEVATLKTGFVRQGFVKEVDSLEARGKELATLLTSKAAALPSQSWKILTSAAPDEVLYVWYSTKSAALKSKFESFVKVWPQARQKMPYLMMQEMRIVPELAGYEDLLEKLFFELMDDKLQTPEEMKAFLEPYSPPAPPPPVSLRRPRAAKKDAKATKARGKKAVVADEGEEGSAAELDEVVIEALDQLKGEDLDAVEVDTETDEAKEKLVKSAEKAVPAKAAPAKAPAKAAPVKAAPGKSAPAKVAAKSVAAKVPVKVAAKKALPVPVTKKTVPAKKSVPEKKAVAKKAAAPAKKAAPKKVAAKKVAVKAVAKKVAAKKVPAKKIVAKKAATVKVAAKKVAIKKAGAKKVAPVKVAAKKAVAKKVAAKKAPAKKTASKKAGPAKKR